MDKTLFAHARPGLLLSMFGTYGVYAALKTTETLHSDGALTITAVAWLSGMALAMTGIVVVWIAGWTTARAIGSSQKRVARPEQYAIRFAASGAAGLAAGTWGLYVTVLETPVVPTANGVWASLPSESPYGALLLGATSGLTVIVWMLVTKSLWQANQDRTRFSKTTWARINTAASTSTAADTQTARQDGEAS